MAGPSAPSTQSLPARPGKQERGGGQERGPRASVVAGHVCPTRLQRCCPGPSRTGANVLTEPDSWPRWRAASPWGSADFRLGRSGKCRGWPALPWLVISPPIHARSETGGYFCHPEVRGGVGFHVRTARTDPDLLAGLIWVQRFPFRPVMQTKMTGHFAPHAFTSCR